MAIRVDFDGGLRALLTHQVLLGGIASPNHDRWLPARLDRRRQRAREVHQRAQRPRPALWQDRLMLQLLGFIIDCPDPMKLAAFYSEVTGRAIMEDSDDNFAGITFGEVDLAFQRVEDYRPPRWPDGEHPKQYHLDFEGGESE